MIPMWLAYLLSVAAVYRLTRLITKDDFPPVLWFRDRLAGGWRPLTTVEREAVSRQPGGNQPFPMQKIDGVVNRWNTRRNWSPAWLGDLVSCPWCASGWIALAVTVYAWAVLDWFGWALALLWWISVWAGASLVASKSWA